MTWRIQNFFKDHTCGYIELPLYVVTIYNCTYKTFFFSKKNYSTFIYGHHFILFDMSTMVMVVTEPSKP